MGEQTSIEWCDHTFNAWIGCEKIAPGCKHCYAAELAAFRGWAEWGGEALGGTRRVASETKWREPLKWNRAAERDGVRRRVFCASLADVWEDWRGPMLNADGLPLIHSGSTAPWEPIDLDNAGHGERVTAADVRRRLFELAEATPWLDWLFLTKRPENVRRLWPFAAPFTASDGGADVIRRRLENVWLGASISCQATADANLPELMNLREFSPVLFASAEPLVERIDLDACGATPCDAVPGASYCEAASRRALNELGRRAASPGRAVRHALEPTPRRPDRRRIANAHLLARKRHGRTHGRRATLSQTKGVVEMNAADWNAADWNVLQAAAVVAAVCVLAAGIMVGLGRRAARGLIGPRRLTLELDADDFDSVQAAIDSFLARPRWSRHDDDVDRYRPGSVVAEICREWARAQERNGRR